MKVITETKIRRNKKINHIQYNFGFVFYLLNLSLVPYLLTIA
jgi:hypothetical protein